MGLFRRKPAAVQEVAPDGLVYDKFAGDEAARALNATAARGDWRAVRDFLSSVDNFDDRAFYVRAAADLKGEQAWLREWTDAEPYSGLAWLVKGAYGVNWAWEARTGQRAQNVSKERFQVFFDRLRMAENDLDEATERDRNDPSPWGHLITCAMGRQLGVPEAKRRLAEATARDPWNNHAHHQMLRMLLPKWFGSLEQMHAFAEETVAAMPAGCRLGDMIAEAQFEHWLVLPAKEDAEYAARPEVARRLAEAAGKSIWHPDYVLRPGWPDGHSYFAHSFAKTGQWTAAAQQFDLLGGIVTTWPWGDFHASEVKGFRLVRDEVYQHVNR